MNWARAKQNPASIKLFEVMRLPIADINAQNDRVREGQNSQAEIARHTAGWIKFHQELFDSWIAQAKAAAKK